MIKSTKDILKIIYNLIYSFVFFLALCLTVLVYFLYEAIHKKPKKPRLLWGVKPLNSLYYASEALKKKGYDSKVVVNELYHTANSKNFDYILFFDLSSYAELNFVFSQTASAFFLIGSIFKYDIYHFFYDGGLLQNTWLKYIEFIFLKLLGKKIILLPYGSDTFVYDKIDPCWRHSLLMSYPKFSKLSSKIERMIRFGGRYADAICGCLVHIVNLPRWDVLPLTWYPINVHEIEPAYPKTDGPIRIVHAPNHRGPKGTEFVIQAVEKLQQDGFDINLVLLEKASNASVLDKIKQSDIVIDQVIFGYALMAIEALAHGKIVISGIEKDREEYKVFSRYSYLDECPVIPASPETLYSQIKNLMMNRSEWPSIGFKSRQFAEKRHSYESAQELFIAIYDKIFFGKDIDLINLYHPILGNHD